MTLKSCIDCKAALFDEFSSSPLNTFMCCSQDAKLTGEVVAVNRFGSDEIVSHVTDCKHFEVEDFQG